MYVHKVHQYKPQLNSLPSAFEYVFVFARTMKSVHF